VIQWLCDCIQHRNGRVSCTAPGNWPCNWCWTRLQFSKWLNLQSFGSEVENAHSIHQKYLANPFIQWSSWPAVAPILYAMMERFGLRLFVDYKALNHSTVKKKYHPPLISVMLDRLNVAWMYLKLDLRNANYLIRVEDNYNSQSVLSIHYSWAESTLVFVYLSITLRESLNLGQ